MEMVGGMGEREKERGVVLVSGGCGMNEVVEGFEVGGKDYVKKGLGMEEVIMGMKWVGGKGLKFREGGGKEGREFEIGN